MALKLGQDNGQTRKHGLVSLETLYAKILILSQLYGTHPIPTANDLFNGENTFLEPRTR